MPNWCLNKLTVSHTDKSAMDRFVTAYNKGTLCNEFLPMPEDIGDGFDWCTNNWGTKWDVGADKRTEKAERYGPRATCSFESAWAPPVGVYEKLVDLGYDVHASYIEPGMGFCGVWHNSADNYIEYRNKDEIPVSIVDNFNLQEFFEEL